ncbi:MAG: AzlC family ABC transporter permease [Pseudomonadota bacterium]
MSKYPRPGVLLKGALAAFSLPALVLMGAMVGFAALARDTGFSLGQTLALTLAVWALPSQVVFVGSVAGGATMAATALAVTLSAVRFMPMIMSWTPVVRGPKTSRVTLLALSCFIAITAWVFAMAKLPALPRADRVRYMAGFAITLALMNASIVAVAFVAIDAIPPVAAALLIFLMPIYFLMSLWGAARAPSERVAMVAGLCLGPMAALLVPGADLLVAGLVGGTIAYLIGRRGRA